jgi:hypothetical protein
LDHIANRDVYISSACAGTTVAIDVDERVFGFVRRQQRAVAAEHGISRNRRPYLGHSRTPDEIERVRASGARSDLRKILKPTKTF